MTRMIFFMFLIFSVPALAEQQLADPALENRARNLFYQIRCVVCDGQTIDSSNAGIAKDMRHLVREHILAGQTDQEILTFLQDRYGDEILTSPPFQGNTLALWLGPFVVFAIGTVIVSLWFRRLQRESSS